MNCIHLLPIVRFGNFTSLISAVLLIAFSLVTSAQAQETRPDFKLDAKAFGKEVYKDVKAAAKKYKGKKIELTGQVSSASKRYNPKGFSLESGLKHRKLAGLVVSINVELPQDLREAGWALGWKQKVSVIGELKKADDNEIVLTNASFKELEKNPTPIVKATDLAAAFARNPKAATAKYAPRYERKQLFLDGKITGITDGPFSSKLIQLEGSGKLPVSCPVPEADAEGLKKGDVVRIKGETRGVFKDKKRGEFVNFVGQVVKLKGK